MKFYIHNFLENWDFDALFTVLETSTEDIHIDIDSQGGNLRAAWKMYDAIRMYKGEVYVNVSGDCMSAAILPLLACKPENRSANSHAEFMIHKPLLEWWDLYLKDEDCVQIHEEIAVETEKLKKCYVERTTADVEQLTAMIEAEQVFGIDMALALGFVTKRNEYVNKQTRRMNKLETAIRNLLVKGGFINQKEYSTANGQTLTVESEENPKVGDETPNADGEYLMPEGETIIVEDGKIAQIITPSEDENGEDQKGEETTEEGSEETTEEGSEEQPAEEDEKDKEIEELKAQIADLQAQLKNAEDEKKEREEKVNAYDRTMALVNKCGGEEALANLLNVESKPQNPKSVVKSSEDMSEDEKVEHLRNIFAKR